MNPYKDLPNLWNIPVPVTHERFRYVKKGKEVCMLECGDETAADALKAYFSL